MSLRQLTRTDTHFLVKYDCDGKVQVRSRGFILHDEVVVVNERYDVRWGRVNDVDEALILASGSENEMRQRQKHGSPKAPTARKRKATVEKTASGKPMATVLVISTPANYHENLPDQEIATTIVTPAAILEGEAPTLAATTATTITATPARTATPATTTVTPAATTATPAATTATPAATTATPARTTATPDATTATQAATTATPAATTATTTATPAATTATPAARQISGHTPFRLGRPMVGIGPLQSQLHATESTLQAVLKEQERARKVEEKRMKQMGELMESVKSIQANQLLLMEMVRNAPRRQPLVELNNVSSNGTIPDQYSIDDVTLRQLHLDSSGPGNFAAHLTQKLNPELFGPGNLRLQYNYYGGGQLSKKELCPTRKEVVKTYASRWYPEVAQEAIWRDTVVPKINELLRRKDSRKKPKDSRHVDENEVEPVPSPDIAFGGLLRFLDGVYMPL